MSIPNGHMSASQRRIRDLEQQVAVLQQNAREFEAFMNFCVECKGTTDTETNEKEFRIYAEALKACEPFRTVRTAMKNDSEGKRYMSVTLASRIILKG